MKRASKENRLSKENHCVEPGMKLKAIKRKITGSSLNASRQSSGGRKSAVNPRTQNSLTGLRDSKLSKRKHTYSNLSQNTPMNGCRKIHNVSQGSPRSPNTSGLIEHPHTHRPKSNLFSLHDRSAVSRPSSLQRMKKMKAQKEKVVDYIVKYLKRTQEPKVAIDSEKQLALTRNLKEFLNYLEDKNIIQSGSTQLEDPAAVQSLIRDLMKLDLSKFYQVAPKKKDKKKGS